MLNSRFLMHSRKNTGGTGGGGGGGGGGSGGLADVRPATITGNFGVDVDAAIIFNSDGTVTFRGDASIASYNWLLTGVASGFEVRATLVSGSLTTSGGGDVADTWLGLGTTRTFRKHKGLGSATVLITVEIRRTSDFSIADSANITLTYNGSEGTIGD